MDIQSLFSLEGRIALVTGGSRGIGKMFVEGLLAAGCARVYISARKVEQMQATIDEFGADRVIGIPADLSQMDGMVALADELRRRETRLDILINNAGIMACPLARVGPGWESQFGINHLGHMAMSLALAPAMQRTDGARLVALSSIGHARSGINWDDPNYTERPYDKWEAYGQAKTADALFALGVDRRGRDVGIRAFSVHPGGIFTPLQRHLPEEEMVALGWKAPDGTIPPMVQAMFKTPEQGASTTVWCATSPQLADRGGVYCEDCDIAQLATDESQRWEHVRTWACDDEGAERLWSLSEKMLADA